MGDVHHFPFPAAEVFKIFDVAHFRVAVWRLGCGVTRVKFALAAAGGRVDVKNKGGGVRWLRGNHYPERSCVYECNSSIIRVMIHLISGLKASLSKSLTALAAVLGMVAPASAAFLLNPVDGVVRNTDLTDADDGTFAGAYVFFGTPYFGSSLSNPAPMVSVNGHILFGQGDGMGDSFLRPLGQTGLTKISPMWHDFQLGSSGQVIEHADPLFRFYGVTWSQLESLANPGTFASFQAIFFEAETTIQGQTFQAGDIAFSYGDLSFYDVSDDAVVGIEDGSDYATLPIFEMTDGAVSKNYYPEFPVGANQYILFRPDGGSGYDVSLQVIPEPGVWFLAAASLLGLVGRRRRC